MSAGDYFHCFFHILFFFSQHTASLLLSVNNKPWFRDSWRSKKNKSQIPEYPNVESLEEVESQLRSNAPLIFAGEVRSLQKKLSDAMDGEGFLLMGGDCAESFKEFSISKVNTHVFVCV
jgi:3-deoxy-D-arabino-heptulosonate 7-phosphate (DAHP) synthase class II